jgi:phage terminase large subunit-like protein
MLAFQQELLHFPSGKHDDMVDALALTGQLLDIMQPPTRKPPKTRVTYWDKAYRPANDTDWGRDATNLKLL